MGHLVNKIEKKKGRTISGNRGEKCCCEPSNDLLNLKYYKITSTCVLHTLAEYSMVTRTNILLIFYLSKQSPPSYWHSFEHTIHHIHHRLQHSCSNTFLNKPNPANDLSCKLHYQKSMIPHYFFQIPHTIINIKDIIVIASKYFKCLNLDK